LNKNILKKNSAMEEGLTVRSLLLRDNITYLKTVKEKKIWNINSQIKTLSLVCKYQDSIHLIYKMSRKSLELEKFEYLHDSSTK
jgi:hypothetical protein